MKHFIFILFLFSPSIALADEGEILRLHDHTFNTDQTWSGTVLIDGVVQFAPEATLTIAPGTTVMFTKNDTDGDGIGENELYVQGRIAASGTKERPITFTSAEEHKKPGDWGALNIMVSEGKKNELANCIIEYGYRGFHMHFSQASVTDCRMRDNFLGIQCQDSKLTISGSEITGNRGAIVFKDSSIAILGSKIADNHWGVRFLYGEVELTGNTVTGNMVNGITFRETKVKATGNVLRGNRKGFSAETAQVDIRDNVVEGNDESGIYLKHSTGEVSGNVVSGNGNSGISVEDSDVGIHRNNITGNALYAVDNNGSMDVNARGNWWGSGEDADIARMVYDKADNPAVGRVDFGSPAPFPFRPQMGK